jgi:hypothetical protein
MNDFVMINSNEEIERVLRSAVADRAEVHCETRNGRSVSLEIRSVNGLSVVFAIKRDAQGVLPMLSSVFQNDIAADVPMEVVLSLIDGQYAIRERISDVSLTTFTIEVGKTILKLQRRSDFRVNVRAEGFSVAIAAEGKLIELPILDLSAGGLRVLWPMQSLGVPPKEKQVFDAELKLSASAIRGSGNEKTARVKIECVRDHGPQKDEKLEAGHAVSFRFRDLGQDEARTILFSCLSVHRARYALR